MSNMVTWLVPSVMTLVAALVAARYSHRQQQAVKAREIKIDQDTKDALTMLKSNIANGSQEPLADYFVTIDLMSEAQCDALRLYLAETAPIITKPGIIAPGTRVTFHVPDQTSDEIKVYYYVLLYNLGGTYDRQTIVTDVSCSAKLDKSRTISILRSAGVPLSADTNEPALAAHNLDDMRSKLPNDLLQALAKHAAKIARDTKDRQDMIHKMVQSAITTSPLENISELDIRMWGSEERAREMLDKLNLYRKDNK